MSVLFLCVLTVHVLSSIIISDQERKVNNRIGQPAAGKNAFRISTELNLQTKKSRKTI